MSLATVEGLSVGIRHGSKVHHAVRGASFTVAENQMLGIVGESGSGKTLMALSLMRLLPPRVSILSGRIVVGGVEILKESESALRRHRGRLIAMVFQNYRESLNPSFTVASQLSPVVARREGISPRQARRRVLELLTLVELRDPERVARSYPHQLSGGMAQRIAIALALACRPRLIVADEPGTGLDVLVREGVAETLRRAVLRETGSGIVISHDMSLIAQVCDHVAVMYRGEIVEHGPVSIVLRQPLHPYTQALIAANAIPKKTEAFPTIPGTPPSLTEHISGCAFHPRCKDQMDVCSDRRPEELQLGQSRVRCHLHGGGDA